MCERCHGVGFLPPSRGGTPSEAIELAPFLILRGTLTRYGIEGVRTSTGSDPSPVFLQAAGMLDGELERLWNEEQGRMMRSETKRRK